MWNICPKRSFRAFSIWTLLGSLLYSRAPFGGQGWAAASPPNYVAALLPPRNPRILNEINICIRKSLNYIYKAIRGSKLRKYPCQNCVDLRNLARNLNLKKIFCWKGVFLQLIQFWPIIFSKKNGNLKIMRKYWRSWFVDFFTENMTFKNLAKNSKCWRWVKPSYENVYCYS